MQMTLKMRSNPVGFHSNGPFFPFIGAFLQRETQSKGVFTMVTDGPPLRLFLALNMRKNEWNDFIQLLWHEISKFVRNFHPDIGGSFISPWNIDLNFGHKFFSIEYCVLSGIRDEKVEVTRDASIRSVELECRNNELQWFEIFARVALRSVSVLNVAGC